MKTRLTELVFILDRSGSMGGLESDTVGGYNSMLDKQKNENGDVRVTTVLFDDRYELIHDRIDIGEIKPITQKEYFVRGCTALLDAIGNTINRISATQQNLSEEKKAEKVLFVIITDGLENASKEFSSRQIRDMITLQKEKNGWEFLFLGANMDAISVAANYGIKESYAVSFHSDSTGTLLNYMVVSNAITSLREGKNLDSHWKAKIEHDFESRKKSR